MNERQNYDDSGDFDRPVQAARITASRGRSDTELARIVAHRHGWRFGPHDELTEDLGPVIAWTIEDAAAAMRELEWIWIRGVNWPNIPHESAPAANAVRARLDQDGRFPDRPRR